MMFFSSRKELKQLKIVESELLAEINNAEETIALTENKCTDVTQRISETVRLEKVEKDKVTHTFLILYVGILFLLMIDFTMLIFLHHRFPI